MTNKIDSFSNKERIAIIVVGYNRLQALSRLLDSINSAVYDSDDVPLVISIDASNNQAVYDYVRSFVWRHGPLLVNIQSERLGLKKHIFQCMSLSHYFKGVIILEDDLFVSPFFYHYANVALDKYGEDEQVAGIALYRNEYDGYCSIPFQPMAYGQDVFAWKSVCSWGEMVNERMWRQFSSWLSRWKEDFDSIDINEFIKGWSRAWSKYYYAYLVSTNKYFIFPIESLTTNFNDAGGEHGGGGSFVQVALQQSKRNYQLADINQLAHYDCYGNNEDLAKWLSIDPQNLTVDFYFVPRKYSGRYVLSCAKLPYKRVKGFALLMRPWELNIKYAVLGDDIILYDRNSDESEAAPERKYSFRQLLYFFGRYKRHFTLSFIIRHYYTRFKAKLYK